MDGGAAHKLGVGQEHQGVLGAVVGVREVDGLAALLGVGHAGDDGVDLALVQGLDQAAPGQLHNDQFVAQGVGNVLCDLHIVAFGIGAGHVLNRPVGVGGGVFLPVAGSIGALHTHAELLDFGGGGLGGGRFLSGSLGGSGGAAAAGGKREDHEGCKQHTDNSSGHFHFHPFKRYRFCLLWVLQYKKPWLRVSHPWLNDKIIIPGKAPELLANDSAPQKSVTVRRIFSASPTENVQNRFPFRRSFLSPHPEL